MPSCISRAKTKTGPERLMKTAPRERKIARQDQPRRTGSADRPQKAGIGIPKASERRSSAQARKPKTRHDQQAADQPQMRWMAGDREAGDRRSPARARAAVQISGVEQQQVDSPAPQARVMAVGLDLARHTRRCRSARRTATTEPAGPTATAAGTRPRRLDMRNASSAACRIATGHRLTPPPP